MKRCNYPIDAVVTWVDGNDERHKAKRMRYGNSAMFNADDVAGDTRYSSVGEIMYCIASINRFAPWINRIYIVTDEQDPKVGEFIKRHFPERQIPTETVDHKVLFRGYEEYLPTFNSLSIATMLWRIPGLSDSFLYFNDDVFLASPAKESDWFEGGKTYIYATRYPVLLARLLRWCKRLGKKHKVFGHKDPMLNAADILGSNYFYLFPHAPVPMRRSWYERFYEQNPHLLRSNICHRFREPSQFSSPTLFYLGAKAEGLLECRPSKGTTSFFKPATDKKGYMQRKIAEANANKELKFVCINSLGETTVEEQELFKAWATRKLDIIWE